MHRAYEYASKPIFRGLFLLFGLSLFGWNSYQMMELPLWGYHPMGWMLGAYFIVLVILWKRITSNIDSFRRLILSTCSGLLLSLAFPMSPLILVVFVAWIPLLVIGNDRNVKFWSMTGHAFHAFFLWNVITTFWVLNTSFAPGIVANALNAFLMTLPWMFFMVSRKLLKPKQAFIGLVAFWISFEYIHLHWEISWPWLNLGHVFSTFPNMVQWYEFTGCFGGSLWIWIVNLTLFFWLKKYISKNKGRWIASLSFIIPLLVSAFLFFTIKNQGPSGEVVIIQPNYEPHYEKFDIPQSQQLSKMLEMADGGITENTKYVLFPETVISRVLLNRIDRHPGIEKFKLLTLKNQGLNLISGISSYRTYPLDSLRNRATRTHISRNRDTTYWDLQNTSIWIKSGEVKELYFKSKLVPGAEIFPYSEWLPFLSPLIDALGGTKEGHLIQKDREIFGEKGMTIGPAICYESIYGEFVGQYIEKGANAMFIMTNDGWWDDTPGHKQHLAFARLRAIEMRRSIARAANTGISCFIDQKGQISQATVYGKDAVIRGSIQFNSSRTFYSKYGDFIAWIAILITILYIFLLLRIRLIPKE